MQSLFRTRATIGFLSTWSIYRGATIDNYTYTLLQGVYAAARECDCNLLLSSGVSLPKSPLSSRTACAMPDNDVDFQPVGPWNCARLIVIPDDFSEAKFAYIQAPHRSGFPIILTTSEKPGP